MSKSASFYLADESDTEALGRKLAEQKPDAAVIYLVGDLGAGKTTFSRGFIQACGHMGNVKSPTYTLIEPYSLPSGEVYHLDLYRLADPAELEYLGMDELGMDNVISLIEWPERGRDYLPPPDLTVELNHRGVGRQATLTAHTPAAMAWLDAATAHFEQISHVSD